MQNLDKDNQQHLANEAYKKGDYNQAFFIYEKLSNCGSSHSARQLGWMYYYGNGVRKSYEKALIMFQMSSRLGDNEAKYGLGMVNRKENRCLDAVRCFHDALRGGFFPAAYALGVTFEKKGNYIWAKNYYAIASNFGHLWSQRRLILFDIKRSVGVERLRHRLALLKIRVKIIHQSIRNSKDYSLYF